MKTFHSKFQKWPLREWRCCGHLWQLLLSPRYPERYRWFPICPRCGEKGLPLKDPSPFLFHSGL